MRKTILLVLLMVSTMQAISQLYIEPVAGWEVDMNNKSRFKMFNPALQVSFATGKNNETTIRIAKAFGIRVHDNDSAFTLDPSKPLYSSAAKTLSPSSFTVSAGERITLVHPNAKSTLALLLNAGMAFQKVKVAYQHDASYTVLNPDQTLNWTGGYLSAGVEYSYRLPYGRIFAQLEAATPLIRRKQSYPSSFGFMAPLSINIGYSIPLKTLTHAKK